MADETRNDTKKNSDEAYIRILARNHNTSTNNHPKPNPKPKKATSKSEIETQQKFFKWYRRLPLIIAIFILAVSFALGVADAVEKIIFRLDSGFLTWLIWMLIGGADAAMCYFVSKMILSQRILTVLYLQKLNENK